jgi:predicted Fe-Mo cluster-binding NifX family protein
LRIAIPTKRHDGLDDTVSEVFGKAKTFTVVDVEDGEVKNVQIVDNPASSCDYGSGPVAVKTLADLNATLVLVTELGPGASGLLDHFNIKKISVKPKTRVADVIKETLIKLKKDGYEQT